jgi:hypothetical protein
MTEKVFILKDNKAKIVCPQCNKSRIIDVSGEIDSYKAARLKHKCTCGYLHTVLLERRKRYRKKTNLPGILIYSISGEKAATCSMIVKDISRAGIGFELKNNVKSDFNIGDKISVEFHLDDKPRSLIKKEAIIKHIHGPFIGAEFCFIDLYDRALGQYMFR